MSITRWDPWGDMVSLREAMNNLLEESFVRPRPGVSGPGMASSLALDVKETPDKFIVTASVPGVPESDIDIGILGDTLRIRGQRKEEIEETGEGSRWLLRERRFGSFERTVCSANVCRSRKGYRQLQRWRLDHRAAKGRSRHAAHHTGPHRSGWHVRPIPTTGSRHPGRPTTRRSFRRITRSLLGGLPNLDVRALPWDSATTDLDVARTTVMLETPR